MKNMMGLNKIILLIMIGMSSLFLVGCNDAGAEFSEKKLNIRPVKAFKLSAPSNKRVLSFPAAAKAAREVDLSFRVSGTMVQLNAETGLKVNKGQLIASLDERDFDIRIKSMEAKLAASKAQLAEAVLQYKRHEKLLVYNAVSRSQYDSLKAAYLMYKAQVEADEKSLEDARNALIDTKLEAPFTGFVHQEFVENHEAVSAGKPVVSLVDLSTIEVELGLPEDLLNRIPEFQSYSVAFDAVPGKLFSASFKEAAEKPNPTTHAYLVTLVLEKAAVEQVRPGMAATVSINVSSNGEEKRFVVPTGALFNRGGKDSLVWIFDEEESTVRSLPVKAEKVTREGVEITGGIKSGQWIVTAGVHHLQDGMKVRLVRKPSETNVGGML